MHMTHIQSNERTNEQPNERNRWINRKKRKLIIYLHYIFSLTKFDCCKAQVILIEIVTETLQDKRYGSPTTNCRMFFDNEEEEKKEQNENEDFLNWPKIPNTRARAIHFIIMDFNVRCSFIVHCFTIGHDILLAHAIFFLFGWHK